MLDTSRILAARNALHDLLGPELTEIIDAIRQDPSTDGDYHVRLPERYDVDRDIPELMSYVARTSNTYGRIARMAGLAKAQVALAESSYQAKYKSNMVGSNDKERVANAIRAAADEHDALATVEAIYIMAEKMENAARVASESARKILDKVQAIEMAHAREARGTLTEKDFRPY